MVITIAKETYEEWKKRKMLLGRIKNTNGVYTLYARNLPANYTPKLLSECKASIKREHEQHFPRLAGNAKFQFKLVPVTATGW